MFRSQQPFWCNIHCLWLSLPMLCSLPAAIYSVIIAYPTLNVVPIAMASRLFANILRPFVTVARTEFLRHSYEWRRLDLADGWDAGDITAIVHHRSYITDASSPRSPTTPTQAGVEVTQPAQPSPFTQMLLDLPDLSPSGFPSPRTSDFETTASGNECIGAATPIAYPHSDDEWSALSEDNHNIYLQTATATTATPSLHQG
jgi:hypothetical protein